MSSCKRDLSDWKQRFCVEVSDRVAVSEVSDLLASHVYLVSSCRATTDAFHGTPVRVVERPPSVTPGTPVLVVERQSPATSEGSRNETPPESGQDLEPAICPICEKTVNDASETEDGDEAVFCDGKCQCWLHRCCTCLPKPEFDKLNEENPFYCPRCSTLVQMKAIRELRDAVAVLSTKVQHLQGVINTAGNNGESVPLTNSASDSAKTEGWATVVGGRQKRQRVSGDGDRSPSGSGRGGRPKNGRPKNRSKSKNNTNNTNSAGRTGRGRVSKNDSGQHVKTTQSRQLPQQQQTDVTRQFTSSASFTGSQNRERILGKRRIWGTLKSCSALTVKNALQRLAAMSENVTVKRKYKQMNGSGLRWWHIVSG